MRKLNVLFVYFVHGLGGDNIDFFNVKIKLEEIFDKLFKCDECDKEVRNKIITFCSNANSGMQSTYPLEIMFENDFNEFTDYFENSLIKTLIRKKNRFNRFIGVDCNIYVSIVGHSLGGNVARGTITKLYQPYIKNEVTYENFFEYIRKQYFFVTRIVPCSYLSLSSPHLGSNISEPNETTTLIKRIEKKMVKTFCNAVIGDVGKELTFQDEKIKTKVNEQEDDIKIGKSKYSLINCCNKESMDALAKFPNRTLTAFLRYDLQVKYCSAMGCIETPLPYLLKNEKELLIKRNDSRIVLYSGYNEGPELEFYQRELFNEKISENFFYINTKLVESPDIDDQIKRALADKREKINKKNNEKLEKASSSNKKLGRRFSLSKKKSGKLFSNNKKSRRNSVNSEKLEKTSSSKEEFEKIISNNEKSEKISSSKEELEKSSSNNEKSEKTTLSKEELEKASSNNKMSEKNSSSNEESEKITSSNIISIEEIIENYEEMEDEFLIDNDNQTEIPVALIKLFNQIPFRRVSIDFVVPYGLVRMLTHGLCLDVDFFLARNKCIRIMAEKTKHFYCHLLIADFIRTSQQSDTYSLLDLLE